MYHIAICDDNRHYLELTRARIESYCEEKNIKLNLECFQDSSLLEDQIKQGHLCDAYILDIEMPNISGLELSKLIRQYSETAYVIFLTAHVMYAMEGYGINVLGYVLKERLQEGLTEALDKLFEQFQRMSNHTLYVIHNQRKHIRILQNDIIYIYKKQRNVYFVLKGNREEWERNTLQEVYEKLHHPSMFFLDRSVIINTEHIWKIVNDCVEMMEGHKIHSSKTHILELKSFLSEI